MKEDSFSARSRGSCGAGGIGIENFENFIAAFGGAQTSADFTVGEHFSDGCESAEMKVIILSWHDKKHDKMDWGVIESFEVDAFFRAPKNGDNIFHGIRKCVRDGDARADAGAYLRFTLFEGSEDALEACFGDISLPDEVVYKLLDSWPMPGGLHIQEDMIDIEQTG